MSNYELIIFIIVRVVYNIYFVFHHSGEILLMNNDIENCFHESLVSFDIDP